MSSLYGGFGGWGSTYSPGAGQFPAMASGVPSGTTAGLPTSSGFPATGVPSGTSAGFPGASFSTNPFTGASADINQIPSIANTGIAGGESQALPYYTSGIGALQQYYGQGADAINQGGQPYQQLFNQAQPGVDQYAAALGLGGPGAQQQAIAAFMASPALQSQLKLGDAAITAQNAASGKTGSGNEALALDQYNQLLGQNMWGQYLQGLLPFMTQQQGAAQGIAGLGTNLAQLFGQEATGVSGGLGNIGSMYYGGATTDVNYQTQAATAAANQSNAYAAMLAGIAGGALSGGGLLGGAAILKSDVNTKENIEPVGSLADGMNIYRYNYIGDPTPRIGLLAQEVEQVVPEAVGEFSPGVKGVNYALATDRAAALMKLANDNYESPRVIYGDGLMEMAA